jgi:hypothetical protein
MNKITAFRNLDFLSSCKNGHRPCLLGPLVELAAGLDSCNGEVKCLRTAGYNLGCADGFQTRL